MEFVDLGTGFHLTGFKNCESAFEAAEELSVEGFKVAYLNEASHVREMEAREFAKGLGEADGLKYQNYRFAKGEAAKKSAVESLKTAVEVLEQKCGHGAKYILIVRKVRKGTPAGSSVKVEMTTI